LLPGTDKRQLPWPPYFFINLAVSLGIRYYASLGKGLGKDSPIEADVGDVVAMARRAMGEESDR
jgi:hypothetical protein